LPDPEVLAAEIVESIETALEQFKAIYEDLRDTQKTIPAWNEHDNKDGTNS